MSASHWTQEAREWAVAGFVLIQTLMMLAPMVRGIAKRKIQSLARAPFALLVAAGLCWWGVAVCWMVWRAAWVSGLVVAALALHLAGFAADPSPPSREDVALLVFQSLVSAALVFMMAG